MADMEAFPRVASQTGNGAEEGRGPEKARFDTLSLASGTKDYRLIVFRP